LRVSKKVLDGEFHVVAPISRRARTVELAAKILLAA
jgi:hypothetical protein